MTKSEDENRSIIQANKSPLAGVLGPTETAIVHALTQSGPDHPSSPSIAQTAVAALVGDWMSEWRTRRLLSFITRTGKVAEANGIDPESLQNLPFGDRYRILENATKTEDPLIEDMWASLLVSALNENRNNDRFIEILSGMIGDDARLLTLIYTVTPIASEHESNLNEAYKIKRSGFVGQKSRRNSWRSSQLKEYPSEKAYEEALGEAQSRVDGTQNKLKSLEQEFVINDKNNARDNLLRYGLIQRRIIDIPETIDNSVSVLVSSDWQGGHNDWEDLRYCDPDGVMAAIDCLHNLIAEHTGYEREDTSPPAIIQYDKRFNICPWNLTSLGHELYEICALRSD